MTTRSSTSPKVKPHLIAVDARTGELVWEVPVDGNFSSGPIVVDGKIISGRSCSPADGPRACYIAAYDPDNGKEIWRTGTIVHPDEPGGDSWGTSRTKNGATSVPGASVATIRHSI